MLQWVGKIPFWGGRIQRFIISRQGGEKTSSYLRDLTFKKHNVKIDLYTYGSCFESGFNLGGTVEIGRYCSFGPNIKYFGANHPIDHAVMSAYFYNKSFSGLDVIDVPRYRLTIGHDVWVGGNVSIVSGCSQIGNGAVIAAGSVVTKDVPPYAIVAGVPAKIIRFRFDDDQVKLLEESRWWELSPIDVMKFYDKIANPSGFAKAIIKQQSRFTSR